MRIIRRRCPLLLIIYLASAFEATTLTSGGPLSANQAAYNVRYYDINLKIDPATQCIAGYVDVRIQSHNDHLNTIELDLVQNYTVSAVVCTADTVSFNHSNNKLLINLRQPLRSDSVNTYRIFYSGSPPVAKRPPWDGGFNWSKDFKGAPWVGVSCQGEGAKIWWPCKDHPSDEPDSVGINIMIPDSLVCASNGTLERIVDIDNGWHTYHWKTRYPINNYCVSINIAAYEIRRKTYHGSREMDIVYYVLAEDTLGADSLLIQVEEMLSFYAQFFGEYPFIDEKFGIAQTDYHGMEHQTINSYGNCYKNNELDYDFLLLHEMGHEWWGNYLTGADWADFWLHEGIDVYAEGMYVEEKFGRDEHLRFFREKAKPRITNEQPVIPKMNATTNEAYSIDIYYKGAYIIHMLRFILGKEKVRSILKTFISSVEDKPDNQVTTQEFIDLVNNYSDRNLDWFFNRYLREKEVPILQTEVKKGRKGTRLTIRWLTPDFHMPVEIAVRKNAEETQERLLVTQSKQVYYFPKGSDIIIDPDGWILYDINLKISFKTRFRHWIDNIIHN